MIDKLTALDSFAEEYRPLSETKKSEFARIVSRLLNSTFLFKGKEGDTNDFYSVVERRDLFASYLAMIDYELIYDEDNGLVMIRNEEGRNRVHLNKFDTAVLLILRKLYNVKKREVSFEDKVIVDVETIVDEMRTAQVFEDEKKAAAYEDTFRKLRRHKIIDFAGSKIDEGTNIQILPSIVVILPQDSLIDFAKRLESFRIKEEKEVVEEGNENENENAD